MNIDKFTETIKACRFCFMCRHLSAVGNVTCRESDTPRGRALLLDKIQGNPALLDDADYVATLYDADLSGACRRHCVSHYDEPGLVLAARRDVVEAGKAPAAVRAMADELSKADIVVSGDDRPDAVYFVDPHTQTDQPEIAAAMGRIMTAASLRVKTITGVDSSKGLSVLGFHKEARSLAERINHEVAASEAKYLVTSCPAAYDAFKNDWPKFGIEHAEGVKVLHSSQFILESIKGGKLRLAPPACRKVCLLPSDYMGNYNDDGEVPRQVLNELGVEAVAPGSNTEESYSCGEWAVLLHRLQPGLVEKLVDRVASQIDNTDDPVVTTSPYTRYAMRQYSPAANVLTIEQLVADCIGGTK